eukprot:6211741-Pleurochrysis_carterae.AAC.7
MPSDACFRFIDAYGEEALEQSVLSALVSAETPQPKADADTATDDADADDTGDDGDPVLADAVALCAALAPRSCPALRHAFAARER